jgi:hypothetical protein
MSFRLIERRFMRHHVEPRGAYFVFMPLEVAGSSGGNGRALAFVPRPVSS